MHVIFRDIRKKLCVENGLIVHSRDSSLGNTYNCVYTKIREN